MRSAIVPQAKKRKWQTLLGGVLMPVVFAGGCDSMSNTDKGVLGGAGIGAVAGGIVGAAVRNPVAGAAIGAGLGGLSGGLIGNNMDKQEARQEARVAAATAAAQQQQRPTIGLIDVVQMTQQNVPEGEIINAINLSPGIITLSPQDLIYLRQQNVSENVVRAMQATAYRAPRAVYAPAYPPPYQPVYVGQPVVGVGYGYYGSRRW